MTEVVFHYASVARPRTPAGDSEVFFCERCGARLSSSRSCEELWVTGSSQAEMVRSFGKKLCEPRS